MHTLPPRLRGALGVALFAAALAALPPARALAQAQAPGGGEEAWPGSPGWRPGTPPHWPSQLQGTGQQTGWNGGPHASLGTGPIAGPPGSPRQPSTAPTKTTPPLAAVPPAFPAPAAPLPSPGEANPSPLPPNGGAKGSSSTVPPDTHQAGNAPAGPSHEPSGGSGAAPPLGPVPVAPTSHQVEITPQGTQHGPSGPHGATPPPGPVPVAPTSHQVEITPQGSHPGTPGTQGTTPPLGPVPVAPTSHQVEITPQGTQHGSSGPHGAIPPSGPVPAAPTSHQAGNAPHGPPPPPNGRSQGSAAQNESGGSLSHEMEEGLERKPPSPSDAQYRHETLALGAFLTQASDLALQRAATQPIRQFAHFMVAQQLALLDVLAHGTTASPPQMNAREAQAVRELRAARGRRFDRRYMTETMRGLEALLRVQQIYIAGSGTDPDLVHIAKLNQAAIREHLALLQGLQRAGGRPLTRQHEASSQPVR